MEQHKIIKGTSDEIWGQVKADMENIAYPFLYRANIQRNEKSIFLNIEVDLGGGFESGFQSTSLTAPVPIQFTTFTSRLNESRNFRFALHDENFIDKLGKFFGMEDVETGYAEFDKQLIIKTNDVEKVKAIFADGQTRRVFQALGGFNLHVAHYDHDDKHDSLELTINREVVDAGELKNIYEAFVHVVEAFEFNWQTSS